jgi:hypothetical protein
MINLIPRFLIGRSRTDEMHYTNIEDLIPTSSAGSCCWIIFTAGIENRGRKFCSESHNNFMVVVLLCVKIQQNDRQLMSTWRRHASLGLGVLLLLSEGVVLAWSRLLLQINSC